MARGETLKYLFDRTVGAACGAFPSRHLCSPTPIPGPTVITRERNLIKKDGHLKRTAVKLEYIVS